MIMARLLGLFALIPTTLLLAVSFFVLFTIRKTEAQGLKAFGYVVSALLWAAALLVLSVGIYTLSTGRHPMMNIMEQMKCGPKQGMMMRGGPMSSMMPDKK
jgi:hypothetical protein